MRQCVEEIERRGMEEVGIYRVSGVATDIQALKAAFDVSEYCPESVEWDRGGAHTETPRGLAEQSLPFLPFCFII